MNVKDCGFNFPEDRLFPSRATIACLVVWVLLLFPCISLFLLTLAGVASGPVAHPAPSYLAHLHYSPMQSSLLTEPLAPPSGMARYLAEVER